ncbi:hypothetical protein VCRA2128O99_90122 [Vibrio crassostreae]|nr:hypothetical protein VCRA2119O145_290031 [Vibrio crassostreae]CAK2022675.1 hypothetical protein VCRA2118O144_320030 [Vibrio crassostreae]CAK2586138.1 hypothetical protein VCRA2121O153_110031 [Vibrio crassostreae]CAK2677076.1 hypothetical protein VCRA2120O150_120030 [Vibrio crassostreae]CAK2887156.1 hypothetical protein VCRA2120O151_310036 [Vibrio crassostreae]
MSLTNKFNAISNCDRYSLLKLYNFMKLDVFTRFGYICMYMIVRGYV